MLAKEHIRSIDQYHKRVIKNDVLNAVRRLVGYIPISQRKISPHTSTKIITARFLRGRRKSES